MKWPPATTAIYDTELDNHITANHLFEVGRYPLDTTDKILQFGYWRNFCLLLRLLAKEKVYIVAARSIVPLNSFRF